MAYFKRDYLELFLGVIRKYMQVRGPMSQKGLAELTGVGDSTISRFLNQKTRDLDSQLIAAIVAKLNIPLHEVIDFVEEEYSERFIKLVKYYKEVTPEKLGEDEPLESPPESIEEKSLSRDRDQIFEKNKEDKSQPTEGFNELENDMRKTKSNFFIGGEKVTLPLDEEELRKTEEKTKTPTTIKDKLDRLSPRQKAYLSEFLNLDIEGRDLMVDVGNSLFRYFKQKGLEF